MLSHAYGTVCCVCWRLRDSCSDEAGGRTCFFSALKRTPFAMCSPHVSHQMLKGTSNLQEAQGAANSQHHCLQTQLPAVGVTPTLGGRGSRPTKMLLLFMHVRPQWVSAAGCDCVPIMQHKLWLRQIAGHCVSHLMTRMPSSSFFALSRSGCWPWNCTHKDVTQVRAAASLGAIWEQLQQIA
jgi:hypothetical protein